MHRSLHEELFNEFGYLASGTHEYHLSQIESILLFSKKRKELFDSFKDFLVHYYCNQSNIDTIYTMGSFVSNKEIPNDIDIAIKLNEKESLNPSLSLFNIENIKSNYSVEIVFIEPESELVKQNLPEIKFASKKLTGYRRLKLEEVQHFSIKMKVLPYDMPQDVKGIIELNMSKFCV